jgi:RimJ/RimL family protein N-acetyltransferase
VELVHLPSGRIIRIRPLGAEDGPRLEAAYDHLSAETKFRRFLGLKPHLTPREVRYLTDVDGCNHVALIATPAENPNWILAVGRFVRLPEDPRAAEFAIVVGDPFQREGIATALLSRLADIAAEQGIERVTATMLADNVAAHRLMRRLAANGLDVGGVSVRLAMEERHTGSVDELEVAPAA